MQFKNFLIILLLSSGCISQPDPQEFSQIDFDLNLLKLNNGYYHAWALIDSKIVNIGNFDSEVTNSFKVPYNLSKADRIFVTVEATDNPAKPSDVVILNGQVKETVELNFPTNFSLVDGFYVLGTPANGENNSDELSGIWFLQAPAPGQIGLYLPELPKGWKYEGWVFNQNTNLTAGRFLRADLADDFHNYTGPGEVPPFPGEDYFVNAPVGVSFPINLSDGKSKTFITVEPDLNGVDLTGADPLYIILSADIPKDAKSHKNYRFKRYLNYVSKGIARID